MYRRLEEQDLEAGRSPSTSDPTPVASRRRSEPQYARLPSEAESEASRQAEAAPIASTSTASTDTGARPKTSSSFWKKLGN